MWQTKRCLAYTSQQVNYRGESVCCMYWVSVCMAVWDVCIRFFTGRVADDSVVCGVVSLCPFTCFIWVCVCIGLSVHTRQC